MTREKGTLNFVDDHGKVVGLNPYPNGKRIRYSIRNNEGHLIADDQLDPIEYVLVGMHARFANDVSFARENDGDGIKAMSFSVIMDRNPNIVFTFNIDGIGGEYYCEDLGLSKADLLSLFMPDKVREAKELVAKMSKSVFVKPTEDKKETEGGFEQPRLIDAPKFSDKRGWFFPMKAPFPIVQANVSESRLGVIRGMHWQKGRFSQRKLISVLTGIIRDVVIDLRPKSPTFKKVFSFLLQSDDGKALYVPSGFAHGFQSLTDSTRIMYLVDKEWSPENERTMNAKSPIFGESGFSYGIASFSDKDGSAPMFDEIGRSEYPD